MTQIESLFFGLKREFWEHRRAILWAPVIFSVLILLLSIVLNVVYHPNTKPSGKSSTTEQQSGQILEDNEAEQQLSIDKRQQRKFGRITFLFLTLAWLVSIFYLLSAFYSDRKDSSVFFWKSLPVSETQNAIYKLVFAVLCFPVVALAISWVLYIVLTVLQLEGMRTVDSGNTWSVVEHAFDAQRLIVMPLIGIIAGTLWGLPLFCYALMVSAMAKKYPFLTFIVPIIALVFAEKILYQESYLLDFIADHSPFGALKALADSPNFEYFFQAQFTDKLPSLVLGCGLALCFSVIAIWYRNHRFEI